MARLPVLLSIALALAPAAWAKDVLWKPCTTRELLTNSQLVVLGTLVALTPGTPGPDSIDRATLLIERVLSGTSPGAEVTLVFPGHRRGQPGLDGQVVPDRSPTLIRYDLDQEGIFFLLDRGDGTYSANHPARFKPRFFLPQILNDLSAE